MYDAKGERTWAVDYDIYGKIRQQQVGVASDCPFRYPGQYEDTETGLYYNRFRYYSPEEGMYVSQDPIGLAGGMVAYGYVRDVNSGVDVWGLFLVDPKTIFFSQNSISQRFTDGSPIQDTINAIKANPEIAKNFKEPIRLMRLEDLPKKVQKRLKFQAAQAGDVFSLDNRRLHVAQAAGADAINARFVTQADLIAEAIAKGERPINLHTRFSTENAGRSIEIRCH